MRFKDLFSSTDNTGYEVRPSNGIRLYNPCYRIPKTEVHVLEFIQRPSNLVVFIDESWYQKTQRYLISFR